MRPSNMSDAGSVADSAYEFVNNTDTESHDGRLTESTGSLSASRPDDVRSLDGSETHNDTDSDVEADHSSRASSIRYADQVLQNPSTQLPTSSLQYGSASEGSGVVVRSIEFQEEDGDDPVLLEKISAKHAIREFTEDESSAMAQRLGLPDAPNRLVAMIRLAMSQSYLSTREPLRLLYVGRADAQRSIVLKICSAICASSKGGIMDQDFFNRHRDGVYNIVPISSFGPAPEVELMQASQYQIKVEHCTSAEEIFYEGGSFPGDTVYSITVEHHKVYTSVFSPSGSVVQPKWDLPHIAIFYCSEGDNVQAERTREAAWAFMSRHGVPSIFITEQQNFSNHPTRCWEDYVDEHTVHLCLESRDPKRPITPQRFPIDYASFADIDNRQMNRHLAYLTGLSEPEETTIEVSTASAKELADFEVLEAFKTTKRVWAEFVEGLDRKRILALVASVLLSLMAPFLFAVFTGWSWRGGSSHLESSHSAGLCPVPGTCAGGFMTTKSSSVATSTTTVMINVTATKTVQVSQAKPSTSALASALSFAGFLSDRPSAAPVDSEYQKPASAPKKTVCSVRIYSPTELLVAIPGRSKALWLAQGAIDIEVYRGDDRLKTKISSVDEGVVVELGRNDAYGVMNVSVITTRRPRINETFEVDFGKTAVAETFRAGLHMLQDAMQKVSSSVEGLSHFVQDTCIPNASTIAKLQDEAVSLFRHTLETARSHAAGRVNWAADNAREQIARGLESAEKLRKGVDLPILQAQIASKLWWLKVQGKMDEYAEYERKASQFLKMKVDELAKGQKSQQKGWSNEPRFLVYSRRRSYWSYRADWAKGTTAARDTNSQDSGRGKWWKKMIMGGG
ncbi:hypothetical protein VTK56DRAFT_6880 [Thermocarpiscus australiensis]